jgi:hypothetical protein
MRNAAVHKVQAEADDDPGRTPSGLEPTPPRLANAGAVGVRALIVGEDENTRSALRAILTDAGIEVAEAATRRSSSSTGRSPVEGSCACAG